MSKKQKIIDLTIVLVLIAIAGILTLALKLDPVPSMLLYYIPPTVFLFTRARKDFWKIFTASFVVGIIMGTALDLIASYNNIWTLDIRMFPVLFGVFPADDWVWWFFSMFFVFTYYEHFIAECEKHTEKWRPRKRLVGLTVFSLLALIAIAFGVEAGYEALRTDYFYIKIAAVLVLPLLLVVLIKYPKILLRLFIWSIPFFFINLLMEVVGVHLGHWSFNSEYIGVVRLFNTTFPYEEVIFWMILGTPALFAIYRGFIEREEVEKKHQ